ncbi:MAG: perosamine synthetase [Gaiellaceae bacterium]|nr:perosamine synthetase [Gaiellaceae bacterium]
MSEPASAPGAASRIGALSVSTDATIRDALEAIDRGALGIAIFVDPATGSFQGLVTDGDVRRALLAGSSLADPVAAIVRTDPTVARVGQERDELAALFSEQVRILPVLDEQGRVADVAVLDRRVHLPVAEPELGDRELAYVAECILSGWISSAGRFVTRFEELFAELCGTSHAVATSNGTTALHLALLAADIGPGDEVIVPSLTFIASANSVTYTGATPVLVDCDPATWTIDPDAVAAALTPATKAIMPVHLYGHPADMDPLVELARQHGLTVIEDAAEAHGATYKGVPVGGIGDLGTFSFYGNKIVTTGEGGMVVTNRADLAERMRILRDHGTQPGTRYWHPVVGFNYRLTNLQAAVGVAQMERIEEILAAKRRIAGWYDRGLASVPGITLPPRASWAENVFWLYSILVDEAELGCSRDEVMAALAERDIDTRPFFPPVHTQPVYANGADLPVSTDLARRGISLPSAVTLREAEAQRVVEALAAVATGARAPI